LFSKKDSDLRAGFQVGKKIITWWSQPFLRSYGTTLFSTFKWKGFGIPTRLASEMLGNNGKDLDIKLHKKDIAKKQICVRLLFASELNF
jgi:hypothetical protein